MQFLKIGDDEINQGQIINIDFSPRHDFDFKDHYVEKHFGKVGFEENLAKKIAVPRARIFVLGRDQPIEVTNSDSIAQLQQIWDQRNVITIASH